MVQLKYFVISLFVIFAIALFFGCIQTTQHTAAVANQTEFENWLTAATDLNAFNGSVGSVGVINNLLDDATSKFNEDSTNKLLDIWVEVNKDVNQKKYNPLVVSRAIYNVNPPIGAKVYSPIIKKVDNENFSVVFLSPLLTLIGKEGSSESISLLIWAYKNSNSQFYPIKYIFSDPIGVTRNPASLNSLYSNLIDESQNTEIRYSCLMALANFGPRISFVLESEALNKVSNEQVKNAITSTIGITKSTLSDLLSDDCKVVRRAENPTKFFECYNTITANSFTEENCNKLSREGDKLMCLTDVGLDKNYSGVNIGSIIG